MRKFFDSVPLKNAMNKILLIFIFYTVAAASFNGFFTKWAFRDFFYNPNENYTFEMMYDGTAERPFVYRQLMISIAKEIRSFIPEEKQEKIISNIEKNNFITNSYKKALISQKFIIEYYITYFMTFLSLLVSMFVLRKICIEITGSELSGTLTPIIIALIFPILETFGGYFYDFGELLFLSLATLFTIKGYWLALILISPIAEYNKESFLFFVATLLPLLTINFSKKKSFFIVTTAIFLSGLVYLYVSKMYIENLGGRVKLHLAEHLGFIFSGWSDTEITYGVFFGMGTFFLHILFIMWIAKNAWGKLSPQWKYHIEIATLINVPLYILFCWPGEIRNLSLLYIGFIAMLSIFIKDAITNKKTD